MVGDSVFLYLFVECFFWVCGLPEKLPSRWQRYRRTWRLFWCRRMFHVYGGRNVLLRRCWTSCRM